MLQSYSDARFSEFDSVELYFTKLKLLKRIINIERP